MKRYVRMMMLVLLMAAGLAAWPASAEELSVQVRNGQLRATPSFLGKVKVPVLYGERVQVVLTQAPWYLVRDMRSNEGWIHQSAVTTKKIAMSAGSGNAQVAASGDELALAGKGFNSDVEAQFKAQNTNVNFTWVDKMERMTVSLPEMESFMKAGDVAPEQGGVR